MPPVDLTQENKKRPSFNTAKVLAAVFFVAIIGMLAVWRPWAPELTSDRTIEVSGAATLKETPDEYVFSPVYEFKNPSKDVALTELTNKNDQLSSKLKELGVSDINIKTNADGFSYPVFVEVDSKTTTYTLQLTVTVTDMQQAQKVQGYLVSTTPVGSVSPNARFSDKKRKELENKARNEATKDARAKADQMAGNLGFKVGKVKSITDGPSTGGVEPTLLKAEDGASKTTQLSVQPGQDSFDYNLTVVYFIR